jgi:hypothetical protein
MLITTIGRSSNACRKSSHFGNASTLYGCVASAPHAPSPQLLINALTRGSHYRGQEHYNGRLGVMKRAGFGQFNWLFPWVVGSSLVRLGRVSSTDSS